VLDKVDKKLVSGCIKGKKRSQEKLYKLFYSYALSVCLAYSKDRNKASEILNEGFFKVFTKIKSYDNKNSFKTWLRRIMVNTAIDYYRSNQKYAFNTSVEKAEFEIYDFDVVDQLTVDEILSMLRRLPDHHRIAFNLYEIEGYSHNEISEMLNIPVGTCRSNLARAKQSLRKMVMENYSISYEKAV